MNLQESIRRILKETYSEKMMRLVGQYMETFYPEFKDGVANVKEFEYNSGRYFMKIYSDPETDKLYAKYIDRKKELELDEEIANSLEGVFNDDMLFIVEWFNNEFGTEAEFLSYTS